MTHVATALRMNTDYCIARARPIQLLSGTLSRALPRKDPPTFCKSFRDLTANHRGRPYTTHRGLKMQAALVEDGYGKKNSGTLDSSNHLSHAIECPVSCKRACYKKLEAVPAARPPRRQNHSFLRNWPGATPKPPATSVLKGPKPQISHRTPTHGFHTLYVTSAY